MITHTNETVLTMVAIMSPISEKEYNVEGVVKDVVDESEVVVRGMFVVLY